jgi:hypothetical protein
MFDDSYWRFFMRHHSASLLVVLSLTFLVALAGSGTRAPAAAADCGDGVGPCRCGDTVVTNTTLNDTDPVTATVCPCDGLLVASGVELNLGGRTISGSGVCIGVRIGPSGSSFEASVGGGRITKFGTGVHSSVEGGYTRLHHLRVIENSGVGVSLSEVGSVIEDCIVSRNGGAGIRLGTGDEPPGGGVVQRCHVDDNQGHGIDVGYRGIVVQKNTVRRNTGRGIVACCRENLVSLNRVEGNGYGLSVGSDFDVPSLLTSVERNVVLRNLAGGVRITGVGVLVEHNQSKFNGSEGFDITGTEHTVTLNIAVSNGGDGYAVSSAGTAFQNNTANHNGRVEPGQPADGYGIRDTTTGSGTGGTDNTYSANRCTGNGLGGSSPQGLCL